MIRGFSRYVFWTTCVTLYVYAQPTNNGLLFFSDKADTETKPTLTQEYNDTNLIIESEQSLLISDSDNGLFTAPMKKRVKKVIVESNESVQPEVKIPKIETVAKDKPAKVKPIKKRAKKVIDKSNKSVKPEVKIPKIETVIKEKPAKVKPMVNKEEIVELNTTLPIKEKPILEAPMKNKPTISQVDISEEGISIKDAILKALRNSYKISAAREKVIQAKRKVDEKVAAYKPTVSLTLNAGGTYLSPYQKPEAKFLKGDGTLNINQNIYAGGKHSNEIKREKANLHLAEEKLKSQVEEETLKVIDAYLSLIYQKMGIEITRNNMLSLKKILNIVATKEAAGASSKGDLNYIKSQVENASSALVKSESKYQNSIAFYEYYVGKLDASNMPIESEFDIVLEDKESIMTMMHNNNAKIQIARLKMDAQKHNLQAQKSKFKPTVDLSITGKDKQSGYISEPQEDRATAILSLNYNLYNGGKDKAVLLGTKSKITELQYKLTDLKESTAYNTKQMYENILSSRESLVHTENEVDANKKVIDSYWIAFKYGTQDIQALLLAQRALNRSELDVIKE
ncbi:MAG TPA: hypothetical protein EYH11_03695, partial [Sulfurimonas autotrophica]|nr:hypothetical protein [Sulfurimonas autotrophica]